MAQTNTAQTIPFPEREVFGIPTADHHRLEPLLCLPDQLVDLLPVQQQLPRAERLMVHDITVAVWTDVAMVQENLSVIDRRIAVLEIDATVAERFDLGPSQHDTGFQLFLDEVVVIGLAISRNDLVLILLLLLHGIPL